MLDTKVYEQRVDELIRQSTVHRLMGNYAEYAEISDVQRRIVQYCNQHGLVLWWRTSDGYHFKRVGWLSIPAAHIHTTYSAAYPDREISEKRLAHKIDQHIDAVFNRASKAAVCEVCNTWTATHKHYSSWVCEKSRCQDAAEAAWYYATNTEEQARKKEFAMTSKQAAFEVYDVVTDGRVKGTILDRWSGVNNEQMYTIKGEKEQFVRGEDSLTLVDKSREYSKQAGSLAELDGARDYFQSESNQAQATSVTARHQFAVGDRVVVNGHKHGTIREIIPTKYRVELDGVHTGYWGVGHEASELTPEPVKLSSEEAWLEVAILVGRLVEERVGTNGWKFGLDDSDKTEIRHQAYVILGGNGVDVGHKFSDRHMLVKARVSDLIARADGRTTC